MTHRKKLVKVALPLEAINEASATTSLRAKRSTATSTRGGNPHARHEYSQWSTRGGNPHTTQEQIASPPAAVRNDDKRKVLCPTAKN